MPLAHAVLALHVDTNGGHFFAGNALSIPSNHMSIKPIRRVRGQWSCTRSTFERTCWPAPRTLRKQSTDGRRAISSVPRQSRSRNGNQATLRNGSLVAPDRGERTAEIRRDAPRGPISSRRLEVSEWIWTLNNCDIGVPRATRSRRSDSSLKSIPERFLIEEGTLRKRQSFKPRCCLLALPSVDHS
jgi:hypothetical protein